ncbi:hypothetical protein AA313_de0207855 [Arthrobotrys entomopaga]|nr:hypothetical protein AA313_de0207855 [Arthrobotrys entomopaga]
MFGPFPRTRNPPFIMHRFNRRSQLLEVRRGESVNLIGQSLPRKRTVFTVGIIDQILFPIRETFISIRVGQYLQQTLVHSLARFHDKESRVRIRMLLLRHPEIYPTGVNVLLAFNLIVFEQGCEMLAVEILPNVGLVRPRNGLLHLRLRHIPDETQRAAEEHVRVEVHDTVVFHHCPHTEFQPDSRIFRREGLFLDFFGDGNRFDNLHDGAVSFQCLDFTVHVRFAYQVVGNHHHEILVISGIRCVKQLVG